jgi:hypothetical protein
LDLPSDGRRAPAVRLEGGRRTDIQDADARLGYAIVSSRAHARRLQDGRPLVSRAFPGLVRIDIITERNDDCVFGVVTRGNAICAGARHCHA